MLAGQHVPDRLVLTLHKLLSPSWPRLFRRVALRCVAIDQALHLGMRAADENSLLARFRLSSGLAADEALEAWRFERSLSQEELVESLRQRDLEAQILGRYHMGENGQRGIGAQYALVVADVVRRTGLDERRLTRPPLMQPGIPWESPFVRELKLRNRFALARARAGEIVRGVAEASRWGLPQALSPERLTAWTAIRWGVDPGTLDEELADRGFASYRELLDAARLAYLHERLSIGPNVEASR